MGVLIYSLFDGNYGGALIYCTYKFGSKNRAHDILLFIVPDLIWLCVFLREVRQKYRYRMGNEQHKKLKTFMYKTVRAFLVGARLGLRGCG